MTTPRGPSRYQESQILTASREQLLLLVYDGILRSVAQARRGLREGSYDQKHAGVARAQALLLELRRTLDFSASPLLAHNLARIYSYLIEHLVKADSHDDDSLLQHIADLVAELREAWLEASRQVAAHQEPPQ